jgi:ferrochelatase
MANCTMEVRNNNHKINNKVVLLQRFCRNAVLSVALLLLTTNQSCGAFQVNHHTNVKNNDYCIQHPKSGAVRSRTVCDAAITLPIDDVVLPSPMMDAVSNEEEEEVKVGVLLLNLGGPETGDDVEGFLYNLFADPDIIRLPKLLAPFQDAVATFISKRRAPKSRAAYESIGGGSPILKYTNAQAKLMSEALQRKYGIDVKTYIGMRYWYPFTEEALEKIREDGINALVIVPLYPQFSISTSGSSLRVLQEQFADLWADESKMAHTVISSWYERPGYVKAMADLINQELDSFTEEELEEGKDSECGIARHVLFSAHGVPQSYIEAGDPYQRQIVECVQKISTLLPSKEDGVEVHLSYQSRVGPIEWLRPYTDDVLPDLGENKKVKNLVVVPISFVSEHIETLEEIDIEYRELAEESGITNWRRCPALNTSPAFIEDMADMVAEALSEPSLSVTEACVANNVGDIQNEEQLRLERLGISSAGIAGVGADDDLRAKQQSKAAKQSSSTSLTMTERLNGRVAIAGIILTLAFEYLFGQPMTQFITSFSHSGPL